jgi:HSP20 family protein
MHGRFISFDPALGLLEELRHQMDRVWNDFDDRWTGPARGPAAAFGPRLDLADTGGSLVVTADVPGLAEKDVEITLNDNVLSLSGTRKAEVPEGYTVHRRERGDYRFARSVALPCKVDPEKTSAALRDGVLTVTLTKVPEARPRQIAIKAQG